MNTARRPWPSLWVKLSLLSIALGFALIPASASASSQDITMTPTTVSPVIQPGGTYKGSFQVVNQGKTGYKFIIYAAPYSVEGEDYTPDFTILPSAPNITGWFNFSTPGSRVEPSQAYKVDYTVTIPENIQPGGYYAAAFAETQYPKASNGLTLNQRVGELFYIQVAGPAVNKGELVSWQSNFVQTPPLTSTLRLKNDGSVHYGTNIHYYVKDIFGHTKFTLTTQKKVLPQTIRRINLSWSKSPPLGLFKVSGDVNFLGRSHQLPTKWVIVISNTVKVMFLVIFIFMLVAVFVISSQRRKKRKKAIENE